MERFEFQFSAATVEPPTGSQLRLNNTDPQLASLMWVRSLTTPGEDVHNLLVVFPVGSTVYVQDWDDHTRYHRYQITAATVDKTDYVEIPIGWVASGQPLLAQKIDLAVVAPADSSSGGGVGTATPYVTVDELFRVLKVRSPTAAQTAAGDRVLESAAFEINSELGTAYLPPYPPLAAEVNLERAVEHWNQQESPFGIVGLGDTVPVPTARDSWDRHAHKLAPLKVSWGFA